MDILMETLAIVVFGFYAIGYFILGGADIGVGMLLPFLARRPHDRRLVIATIAPFFLGNEVWLVATAGVLIGAFPTLEGTLFTGQFPAIVALLLGWITRDMGLWLRGRSYSPAWHASCDGAICVGSWIVALSWGWILASVLGGQYDGFAVNLATAVGAAAIAILFAVHGLAFASIRLSGELRRRAFAFAGEKFTFALTGIGMIVLGLVAGSRLPLAESAADPTSLTLLVPTVVVITPILVAAQAGAWWLFRHRVVQPSYL